MTRFEKQGLTGKWYIKRSWFGLFKIMVENLYLVRELDHEGDVKQEYEFTEYEPSTDEDRIKLGCFNIFE